MIHFIDKVLENLAPYVPLAQSLLWPLVVLSFVLLFRESFERLLSVIIDRLESGSSIEAGPFKLGKKLASPSAEDRNNKLVSQIKEAGAASEKDETEKGSTRTKPTVVNPDSFIRKQEMERFIKIENAALTRISEILGIPITREVKPTSRSTTIFDGVALDPKGFRIVEVKMLRNSKHIEATVRRFLDSVSSFCLSLEEKSRLFVSVVLAVVIAKDYEGDEAAVGCILSTVIKGYAFPTRVEQFRESDLLMDENAQHEAVGSSR